MTDHKNTMLKAIEDSFIQYSGAVLQSRALVDSRDFLKPSARQIFYCMYTDGFVHNKPIQKTQKALGSAFRLYIHGDSSALGIIMRNGQPFSMRYPLVEIEGSSGNLIETGNWAASRYTSSRLSPLAAHLFEDIKKDTITEWRDSYDDTEQYPAVLPTKGFFNVVNGTMGIGIGLASSIPSFNLKDVSNALIKLLWNPDAKFEELYCPPDFATGGFLINEDEVKESLKNGQGKSCKLRSKIEYSEKDHCLIVTEIPYGVYTNTICSQLDKIIYPDPKDEKPLLNPGINRFNDLTGETPNIKIYLEPFADPNDVINYLYQKTSLQSHYGINMTLLEKGRFPKVFTWKGLLSEFLDHQKEVFLRGFNYDLNELKKRLHIVEGLLKAIDIIDEVITAIKSSENNSAAKGNLKEKFGFSEEQATAILNMRLSRLAKLESDKYKKEQEELNKNISAITAIVEDEELLFKEIEKEITIISNKFGDGRRTKVVTLDEEESRLLYFTTDGKCALTKPKFAKVVAKEFSSADSYLGVTTKGVVHMMYEIPGRSKQVFKVDPNDEIIYASSFTPDSYLTIYTKDDKFRCLSIKAMNKHRTTLSLDNIIEAQVVSDKLTKDQYKKLRK